MSFFRKRAKNTAMQSRNHQKEDLTKQIIEIPRFRDTFREQGR